MKNSMFDFRNAKGFTLIELLVVIAIIGILSAVVITPLYSARKKGVDATIKGDIAQIGVAAAIYYDSNQGYGTTTSICDNMFIDTNSGMFASIKDMVTKTGGTFNPDGSIASYGGVACRSTGDKFAAAVYLTTPGAGGFCVDSSSGTPKSTPDPTTALSAADLISRSGTTDGTCI